MKTKSALFYGTRVYTQSSLSVFTTLAAQLSSTTSYRPVGTMVQIMPRLYTVSKVLTVLKWQMITTLNRKLLENQRVQNHFASYEVHIGNFFSASRVCLRLLLAIVIFVLTDKQTDRTITLPIAHAHA